MVTEINEKLLPMKAHYFLFNAGESISYKNLLKFLNISAKECEKKHKKKEYLNFLSLVGTAPVVPFMPTLARQLGYSSMFV